MAGPWVVYIDDEANNVNIKMEAAAQAANGVTGTPTPPNALFWPYGKKNLRHITGKKTGGSGGTYARMVCLDPAGTLYQNAASTWTSAAGGTYQHLGTLGERKPDNHVS